MVPLNQRELLAFEDTPAEPPVETMEQRHRVYPGEGIAPLRRIVEVLKQKGYNGPASLDLFNRPCRLRTPMKSPERREPRSSR